MRRLPTALRAAAPSIRAPLPRRCPRRPPSTRTRSHLRRAPSTKHRSMRMPHNPSPCIPSAMTRVSAPRAQSHSSRTVSRVTGRAIFSIFQLFPIFKPYVSCKCMSTSPIIYVILNTYHKRTRNACYTTTDRTNARPRQRRVPSRPVQFIFFIYKFYLSAPTHRFQYSEATISAS